MKTVYDFTVKDRKGKDVSLKEYANEVLLIVNTATKCGFTPQYDEGTGHEERQGKMGKTMGAHDWWVLGGDGKLSRKH